MRLILTIKIAVRCISLHILLLYRLPHESMVGLFFFSLPSFIPQSKELPSIIRPDSVNVKSTSSNTVIRLLHYPPGSALIRLATMDLLNMLVTNQFVNLCGATTSPPRLFLAWVCIASVRISFCFCEIFLWKD